MNNAEFECIQYISVNNALVLISVVSISDAVCIKQKALEFEICFSGDFSLFIMFFCLFFGKEEFEFKIYNWVLYFLKHAPANQDTRTNYAMRLKSVYREISFVLLCYRFLVILELCWISVM